MADPFFQGLLLQASLILALGAQNLFVLESGLCKRRHLFVATVCSLCDLFLILLGVLGAAAIFAVVPQLKVILGISGVGFLFYYAILKLKEGLSTKSYKTTMEIQSKESSSLHQVFFTTLAFSLLNPHVYLDTIILLGGYSAKFPTISARLFFGLGAGTTSVVWFFCLALLSSSLSRVLANEKGMRVIAVVSGLVLLALSLKLGGEVWNGI